MERINRDIAWQDFSVSLNSDELSFVTLTAWLSGVENAKYVQSNYTGRQEEDPGHNRYLPSKTTEENGYGAWCDLFYQFSYHIADKQTLTVGERDDRISNMMNEIQDFWNRTDIEEMLSMTEDDIVSKLKILQVLRKWTNETGFKRLSRTVIGSEANLDFYRSQILVQARYLAHCQRK